MSAPFAALDPAADQTAYNPQRTGARIRRLREERGLTNLQLARAAQLSTGMLSFVERGHRTGTLTTLRRIAHALGVQPGALLDDVEPSLIPTDGLGVTEAHAIGAGILAGVKGQPTEPQVLTWDWREQPNLDAMAKAAGRLGVFLHQADTGTDQIALVMADRPLNTAEVAEIWRRYWDEERA